MTNWPPASVVPTSDAGEAIDGCATARNGDLRACAGHSVPGVDRIGSAAAVRDCAIDNMRPPSVPKSSLTSRSPVIGVGANSAVSVSIKSSKLATNMGAPAPSTSICCRLLLLMPPPTPIAVTLMSLSLTKLVPQADEWCHSKPGPLLPSILVGIAVAQEEHLIVGGLIGCIVGQQWS